MEALNPLNLTWGGYGHISGKKENVAKVEA